MLSQEKQSIFIFLARLKENKWITCPPPPRKKQYFDALRNLDSLKTAGTPSAIFLIVFFFFAYGNLYVCPAVRVPALTKKNLIQ
jgi:hypothetical protein